MDNNGNGFVSKTVYMHPVYLVLDVLAPSFKDRGQGDGHGHEHCCKNAAARSARELIPQHEVVEDVTALWGCTSILYRVHGTQHTGLERESREMGVMNIHVYLYLYMCVY
jgi:hypothetical protein